MKNQINSKLQNFKLETWQKLLLLFLIFSSMAHVQSWTQMGMGNGGQRR